MASDNIDPDFDSWKVPQPKKYLRNREVPVLSGSRDDLLELAKFANRLKLQPVKSTEQVFEQIRPEMPRKLVVEDGHIQLPDPLTLKDCEA